MSDDLDNRHPILRELAFTWDKLSFNALESDITYATQVLGISMVVWGIFGLMYQPDLKWFANGFALEVSPWMWGVNSIMYGVALVHLAVRGFPKGRSLLIGAYGAMMWGWIALGRPSSSFSSGMTLNLVIIFHSCVIVQRSGEKKTP